MNLVIRSSFFFDTFEKGKKQEIKTDSIKIEKELATVKETLAKLQSHQEKYNTNSQLSEQIEQKMATVNRLSAKISKARLNLNYYFI